MRVDIITIFPKMFAPVLSESILKRAQEKRLLDLHLHDLRDYTLDAHRKVDDRPFGGGPGMVFRPEPVFRAVEKITSGLKRKKTRIILLSPRGKRLTQQLAQRYSRYSHLILICAHYEGIDERVRQKLATDEISIGDYVLTGGELPAMVLVDAITRLVPGVLGKEASVEFESFSQGLLEYPHYTRPAEFRRMKVPAVLLSGNHRQIEHWRKTMALKVTKKQRPDLLTQEGRSLTA